MINLCSELYYFLESVNTKNIKTLNIVYLCVLGCMVKPRADLEFPLQAGHFCIYGTFSQEQ